MQAQKSAFDYPVATHTTHQADNFHDDGRDVEIEMQRFCACMFEFCCLAMSASWRLSSADMAPAGLTLEILRGVARIWYFPLYK